MKRMLRDLAVGLAAVAFITFAIVQLAPRLDFTKPAHAQPTIATPNVYFYASVTTAQQIIGANPSRHGLQICNSGGTNALWAMPNVATINTGAIVNPATNVGVPIAAIASNVPSCFSPPTGLTTTQPWQGQSASGTPVTVLEYP